MPFKNIVGKGENAGDHNVFYSSQNKFQLLFTFILSSAYAFNLVQSRNMPFGKELILWCLVGRMQGLRTCGSMPYVTNSFGGLRIVIPLWENSQ